MSPMTPEEFALGMVIGCLIALAVIVATILFDRGNP